jgi:hypothetical protein
MMQIKRGNKNWLQGKVAHRMFIAFNGVENFPGIIGLDGEIMMEIPAFHIQNVKSTIAEKRMQFFGKLFKWFKNQFQQQGFIMTHEQTLQALRIIKS